MKRKDKILVFGVTLVFIATLAMLVVSSMFSMQKQTEENCFRYLDEATHRLADDLYRTTDMDRTVLTAMASIIASESNSSDSAICDILNSYNSIASYVNYAELLRPDNTILDSDGTVREVGGLFDFDEECRKGAYISNIEYSTKNPENRVVRNAVPVVKDGETIFMLYGVVVLSDFAKEYKTNLYGGNVYVYLEDGNTGDFLLDTWHKDFGNITDFYDREMLSKDTFEDAAANMRNGVSGDLAFVSQSTGDTLYLHYEPVGVNNWNVLVTVQDQYAMADSQSVNRIMYRTVMAAGILIFAYMIFIVSLLLNAYRSIRKIGLNDEITGLQNRNAYDAFILHNKSVLFQSLACIYIDVNGLHEINNIQGHEAGDQMLRCVANALKAEFPRHSIFRAGGDEFVVITGELDQEKCSNKADRVNHSLCSQGYSIAYGISVESEVTGCEAVIHAADEKMLENKKQYYSMHDRRER